KAWQRAGRNSDGGLYSEDVRQHLAICFEGSRTCRSWSTASTRPSGESNDLTRGAHESQSSHSYDCIAGRSSSNANRSRLPDGERESSTVSGASGAKDYQRHEDDDQESICAKGKTVGGTVANIGEATACRSAVCEEIRNWADCAPAGKGSIK